MPDTRQREDDMPKIPPKEFWDKMYAKIKKANPDYTDEQIRATIGDIWYHKIGAKAKEKYEALRRKRERKQKLKKAIHFILPEDTDAENYELREVTIPK